MKANGTPAKTRVGIVGVGRIGTLHLQKFLAEPSAEVVGFYEIDDARRADVAARTGAQAFALLEELLFEVDAVVIAASTSQHASLVRACLEGNVHVLVEKPFSGVIAEATALTQLAAERGLRLHVGFLERLRLRELLSLLPAMRPRYWETVRESTVLGRDRDLDVIADLLVHDVDLVLDLAGRKPLAVQASGFSLASDRCDWVEARLDFGDGAVARLRASRIAAVGRRTVELADGERFTELDLLKNRVAWRDRGHPFAELHREDFDGLQRQASLFLASCRGEEVPLATAEQTLGVLEVLASIATAVGARRASVESVREEASTVSGSEA